jgi:hypothetical protein
MSEYSAKPGIFTTYELGPKDMREGQTLTENQRMYLHNMRAIKAEALMRLPFTPENVMDFAQQEAYLTAQIELLDELLSPPEVSDEPENN